MRIVLKDGIVLLDGKLVKLDILIHDGVIAGIYDGLLLNDGYDIVDCEGLFIAPGFVDMHTHLREPGFEYKETINTGTRAAAAGGFTTVCAMPNTDPVIDKVDVISNFYSRVKKSALTKVYSYAAITNGLSTEEIVDFKSLKLSGAIGFTNDGVGVQMAGTMYEAMKKLSDLDMILAAHCEDNSLKKSGVVHKGNVSERLKLEGIPSLAESIQVARDILIAEETGCRYHVCHVSTKETVRLIRNAKARGVKVTCEVTPHHLLLNENDIKNDDANYKMNPPLRSKEDQQELISALLDGSIDVVATDHAPHSTSDKEQGMSKSPFGIIGLEFVFSLLYTDLVKSNIITLDKLIHLLSYRPSKILKLDTGVMCIGKPADLAIIDLNANYTICPPFCSMSSNTPFIGREVFGLIKATFVNGVKIYERI